MQKIYSFFGAKRKINIFYISILISLLVHLFSTVFTLPEDLTKVKSQDSFIQLNIKLGSSADKHIKEVSEEGTKKENLAKQQKSDNLKKENLVAENKVQGADANAILKDNKAVLSSKKSVSNIKKSFNKKKINKKEVPDKKKILTSKNKRIAQKDNLKSENDIKKDFSKKRIYKAAKYKVEDSKSNVAKLNYKKRKKSNLLHSANQGFELGNSIEEFYKGKLTYEQLLPLWLNKFRHYPEKAEKMKIDGKGIIYIKINREGEVLSFKILQSTGYRILDKALSDMVHKAEPLFPVPGHYHPEKKTLAFQISFPSQVPLK